jgi:hypothetical protein
MLPKRMEISRIYFYCLDKNSIQEVENGRSEKLSEAIIRGDQRTAVEVTKAALSEGTAPGAI